jgi:hypothetical protein
MIGARIGGARGRVTTSVAAVATLLLLAACARGPSTPATAVMQFYTVLDALGIRRVPDPVQWQSLRPFIADSLAKALTHARQMRDSARMRAPGDKPPFADGDPFSSLFEGRTSFRVDSTITRGDSALVVTIFTNDTQKPAVTWTDTVVVLKQGDMHRVADVRYGTEWEFGYRGRLIELLLAR